MLICLKLKYTVKHRYTVDRWKTNKKGQNLKSTWFWVFEVLFTGSELNVFYIYLKIITIWNIFLMPCVVQFGDTYKSIIASLKQKISQGLDNSNTSI